MIAPVAPGAPRSGGGLILPGLGRSLTARQWLLSVLQPDTGNSPPVVPAPIKTILHLAFLAALLLGGGGLARLHAQATPNDLVEQGLTKSDKGDLDGAIADFNQALKLDPNFVRALGNRGNAQKDKGDLDGALADFSRIIELDPKSAHAYAGRAEVKRNKGDLDGAIADFNRAIELDPKDAAAYAARGRVKHDKGDLDGATADFNQALKLDPSLADAIRQAASVSEPRMVFPSASINGQPVRAILDTGSSLAVLLTTQEVRRLGLRVTPTPNPVANAPEIVLTAPAELTVGAASVTAQVATFNLPGYNSGLMVGWPAVKDNLLLFMGAPRTVALVTGDDAPVPDTSGWLKVKISANHHDVLTLEIPSPDGTTRTFLVDTGDSQGVALPMDRWKEWRAAHPLASLPTKVTIHGVAGEWKAEETLADNLSLGALTLTNVPLRNFGNDEDTQGHFDGVLGLAALARMDLVVDGKHGVAYLRPLPPSGSGAAGTASPPPAAQNQDWTVVRQTGLSRTAIMLNAVKEKLGTGDVAGAIADCTRALQMDPLAVDAWFLRAAAKMQQADYAGALADFTRVLEFDPKNADAYAYRGAIKARTGDYAGALADLNQAVELGTKNAEAYANRGAVKAQTGDHAGALADYTRVLELDPKNANAYTGRGEVKARTGDGAGAIADFTQAIGLDPLNVKAWGMRAMVKMDMTDFAGALADYTHALELNPKNYGTYFGRGSVKAQTGDYAGALADYNRALELDPRYADAYARRGSVKFQTGDNAGALADYTHALELDPKNVEAYSGRGSVKKQTGDYAGALADYNQALELAPKDASSHSSRAMVREFLGDPAGALADYDQAIALNPADATYYRLYRQLLQLKQGAAPADFAQTVGGWKEGWAKTIGQFLAGQRDEAALFAAAEKSGEEPVSGQRCEAWYFAGQMRLLKGDQAGAREAFQKSVATNQRDYNEYLFAQAALARLAAEGKQ